MSLVVSLISTVLCAVVYIRMYKKDLPDPITKRKAAVPPVLGFFAPVLSTAAVGLLSVALVSIFGGDIVTKIPSLILRSLVSSFILAGFTEEAIKFLIYLIVLKITKPKNVYEYGMLCSGIGFGFTALEILLYGATNTLVAVARLPLFAMHMIFGLVMGIFWGLAKYSRQHGVSGSGKYTFLALFLPVLWHTAIDAATTANAGIRAGDETQQKIAVVIALVMIAASIAGEIILLTRFRKKSSEYCGMEINVK